MTSWRLTAILVIFFIPSLLFARDIEVLVEDEDLFMPLEGAVVSSRGGRQFICDENGVARVSLPDDRQTIVTITYPGYETMRLTIPAVGEGVERFTASLRLGGVMTSQELVLEAERPDTSETKSGRSVAISDRELARTAEIGIIEDVMTSVKLLPGVGYTGMFGAMPSIRGGDPGDLVAAFDGFYLERPYHWLGSVSIFDPKMVSSARLSHGVFSARYGHTTSGLLEITSKSPSTTEVNLETAIGSSAASLNLSYPFNGKGGILFMGKVTYWDTFVWTLKGLSRVIENEYLDQVNSISTAPFIRSAALSANYRFTENLEGRLNFFFGSDGVGAKANTEYDDEDVEGYIDVIADYGNYQGFLIGGITASPLPVLALKATSGVGFIRTISDDLIKNDVTVAYNKDEFLPLIPNIPPLNIKDMLTAREKYSAPDLSADVNVDHSIFNAQGRGDLDWDLGKGFIAAFGVQELYSLWVQNQSFNMAMEFQVHDKNGDILLIEDEKGNKIEITDRFPEIASILKTFFPGVPNLAIIQPIPFSTKLRNQGFTTSAYGLIEYTSPNQRLGMELGLRLDHLYIFGKNFSAQTEPAFNPRLNIDFNILKSAGIVDSLDFTIGTGLFSSVDSLVSFVDEDLVAIKDKLKFNRTLTSILGIKVDVAQSYSFNIEGYYKYVFDRTYITADPASVEGISAIFNFDGIGHVAGFDLQLQKLESRYFDGWISYTFTWAQYKDPSGGGVGLNMMGVDGVEGWYYPSFHRFHNANIVLNIKPVQWFNISTRFGFASGQLRNRSIESKTISPYPVIYIDEDSGEMTVIQKYFRETEKTWKERAPWALPWDLKFSFFLFDKKGKVGTEIYLAAENLSSIFYHPDSPSDNTAFNEYTGREYDPGAASFNLNFPLISFGFKWRY